MKGTPEINEQLGTLTGNSATSCTSTPDLLRVADEMTMHTTHTTLPQCADWSLNRKPKQSTPGRKLRKHFFNVDIFLNALILTYKNY